jgi:hypothetical protein
MPEVINLTTDDTEPFFHEDTLCEARRSQTRKGRERTNSNFVFSFIGLTIASPTLRVRDFVAIFSLVDSVVFSGLTKIK